MRFTRVLLKESYKWRFKQVWRDKNKFYDPPVAEPFRKDSAFAAVRAADLVQQNAEVAEWNPLIPDDLQFKAPPTIKDHPDYHEDHVYEFTPTTELLEGERQALLLTKTQPFYELPSSVKDLIGRHELPDQDLLVQRIIMQSNIWDPTKEKLPKRSNPDLPIWKFKAEVGIPDLKVASMTARKLWNLCESLGALYPDLLFSRRTAVESILSTFFYTHGQRHVMIRGKHAATTYTNRPLAPFASQDAVDESVLFKLPDIYPLVPTIDLEKQKVWRPENVTGFQEGFSHPYPHTALLPFSNNWGVSQHNARSLAFCFGHALASAKQRFGHDVKNLPEPVSVQCVSTNGSIFHFTCFQLNTLDFSSINGIKNLVWFDSNNAMFNKILPKRAMLRNTKYEDYDPEAFKKFLAFYLSGAKLEKVSENNRLESSENASRK